jgi:hypothetical protein
MLMMKKDGKLLSHHFTLRRDGFLEQMLLNVVRQTAPSPGDSLSQGMKKLLSANVGKLIHGNLA